MRTLKPDDGGAALVLYEAYKDRADCPAREVFVPAAKRRYEMAYIVDGDEVLGVICRNAGAVHIGILPKWRRRWATRSFIREALAWVRESGTVWTRVKAGNAAAERLVSGVGFLRKEGGRYELQDQP